MTVTTISTLAELTSTSVATYGTIDNSAKGSGAAAKTQLIADLQDPAKNGGFTATQAKEFADRYFFLDQLPNVPLNGLEKRGQAQINWTAMDACIIPLHAAPRTQPG